VPVVTAAPALFPIATLYASVAVVKFCADKALVPIATDLEPNVSLDKASPPTATL